MTHLCTPVFLSLIRSCSGPHSRGKIRRAFLVTPAWEPYYRLPASEIQPFEADCSPVNAPLFSGRNQTRGAISSEESPKFYLRTRACSSTHPGQGKQTRCNYHVRTTSINYLRTGLISKKDPPETWRLHGLSGGAVPPSLCAISRGVTHGYPPHRKLPG